MRRHRSRAKETFEHRPRELSISVNGFILGSQKVRSELSEQTLNINVGEKIGFVEVLSEQGIRLLCMNVEPPPDGPGEQVAHVELSDGRSLELSLDFHGLWPNLHVVYHDPLLKEMDQPLGENVAPAPQESPPEAASRAPILEYKPRLLRDRLHPKFWLQPIPAISVVALLTIVSLLFYQLRPPSVSAAVLLARASASEEASFDDLTMDVHRTLRLEERTSPRGEFVTRRRIELWASAAKGVKARRVYDEKGELLAGEWTSADGSQVVYHRGGKTETLPAPAIGFSMPVDVDDIWRREPSAEAFSSLIQRVDRATVRETKEAYVLSYADDAGGSAGGLVRAMLTLAKDDYRPIKEVLVVKEQDGIREYRLTESGFVRYPAEEVSPQMFKPDPELVGSTSKRKEAKRQVPPLSESRQLSRAELLQLEIEALERLDRVGASLGEQVTLNRLPSGTLEVKALVETTDRKQEVLQALGPLTQNPAVTIEVTDVAEAFQSSQSQPSGPTTVRQVEVREEQIPVYSELRRYFVERAERSSSANRNEVPGEAVEKQVHEFADRVLNRSRRALLRAWALKNLINRFSLEELRTLSPKARAKLRAMIRRHAQAFQIETGELRRELQPIFFADMSRDGAVAGEEITDDILRAQAIELLFEMGYAHEKVIRLAFTVAYPKRPASAAGEVRELWRSLNQAERLAMQIQAAP